MKTTSTLIAASVLSLLPLGRALACTNQTVDYFAPPASQYGNFIDQGGYHLSLCNAAHGPPGPSATCNNIDLKGYLFVPHATSSTNSAPDVANTHDHTLPLVIWVDGSWSNPTDATKPNPATYPTGCPIGQMFANHGYVMLTVVRRGYKPSTGENADVFYANLTDTHTNNDLADLTYLANQSFEVQEAINFMLREKNLDGQLLIDQTKVAVAGHSIGGIVNLYFGNAGNLQPIKDAGIPSGATQAKVKILFSPSEESWDGFDREVSGDPSGSGLLDDQSPSLNSLKLAAQHSSMPMYFLGPINDANTRSVLVLAKAAGDWRLGTDDGNPFGDPQPNYGLNRDCRLRILEDTSLDSAQKTRKIVDTCPLPREVQSALFPWVQLSSDLDANGDPVDSSAHGLFITDATQIAKWRPSVLDFLARYGVTP